MSTRVFQTPSGVSIELPFVLVEGYHYVKIPANKILEYLPIVWATLPDKTKPKYVTCHWTAAPYNVPFNDYQINVGDDYIYVSLFATQYSSFSHTWKRNSLNLGITYMAMGGAVTNGMYAMDIRKSPNMVNTGSLALAAVMKFFSLKPSQVTDHDAWSKVDGYDSYRWDNQLQLTPKETLFQRNLSEAQKILTGTSVLVKDESKHIPTQAAPPVCASDTVFADVCKKDWFADALQYLYERKVFSGTKVDNKLHFLPNEPLLRQELATILNAFLMSQGLLNNTTATSPIYQDVPSSVWYFSAVQNLHSLGLMRGRSTSLAQFDPAAPVMRAELAVVFSGVLELLKKNGKVVPPSKERDLYFVDVDTKDWFYQAIRSTINHGLLTGSKDSKLGNVFKPQDTLMRKEAAVAFYKLYVSSGE